MSGQRDFYGGLADLPDADNGKRKKHGDHGQWCCSDHTLNVIKTVGVVVGVFLFGGLLIALVAKKDDLDATTRATVGMHDDTIQMKQDAEKWFKSFREHFPANQETLSTEQVKESKSLLSSERYS